MNRESVYSVKDIFIKDDFTFMLRSERSSKGPSTIYTVTYKATDVSGNESMVSFTVEVPHNQQTDSFLFFCFQQPE